MDWSRWERVLQAVHNPKHEVTIGLVGKYIDLPDAYLSVTEALKAGGFAQETHVTITLDPVRPVRDAGGRGQGARRPRRHRRARAGSASAASRASSAR